MSIKLGLNWSYTSGNHQTIPPELFSLLQSIAEYGSLRLAAKQNNISYRHAWGLIQTWNQIFLSPVVEMKRGRGKGTQLTPSGEKLLWEYARISARIEPELQNLASKLSADLSALIPSNTNHKLQVAASHGLVIASLVELAKQTLNLDLDFQFYGSLDALKRYKKNECEIAGFHLPESHMGQSVLPKIRPFINPDKDILVYALRRHQGLMTVPNNPKQIQNLNDLTRHGIKFINRQVQSGTRTTFDELLHLANIPSNLINGYDNEEFTHSAVAALIASGAADCGYGIEAAAVQFNLHFIPLNWESYWFVFPKHKMNDHSISQFIALLGSLDLKTMSKQFKGYDCNRSGTLVTPDKDLYCLIL